MVHSRFMRKKGTLAEFLERKILHIKWNAEACYALRVGMHNLISSVGIVQISAMNMNADTHNRQKNGKGPSVGCSAG